MYGGRAIDGFDRRVLKTYMDEYMGDTEQFNMDWRADGVMVQFFARNQKNENMKEETKTNTSAQ